MVGGAPLKSSDRGEWVLCDPSAGTLAPFAGLAASPRRLVPGGSMMPDNCMAAEASNYKPNRARQTCRKRLSPCSLGYKSRK